MTVVRAARRKQKELMAASGTVGNGSSGSGLKIGA